MSVAVRIISCVNASGIKSISSTKIETIAPEKREMIKLFSCIFSRAFKKSRKPSPIHKERTASISLPPNIKEKKKPLKAPMRIINQEGYSAFVSILLKTKSICPGFASDFLCARRRLSSFTRDIFFKFTSRRVTRRNAVWKLSFESVYETCTTVGVTKAVAVFAPREIAVCVAVSSAR